MSHPMNIYWIRNIKVYHMMCHHWFDLILLLLITADSRPLMGL